MCAFDVRRRDLPSVLPQAEVPDAIMKMAVSVNFILLWME